ncbi:hypothetical protein ACWCOP_09200 [Maricaulaceae bacterium MS644]
MADESDENTTEHGDFGKALRGGLCGFGAALAFAGAAFLAFNAKAQGQAPVERPALVSALEECESGAQESALTARALGACDLLMRSPDLDAAMRARVLINRGQIAHRRGQAGPARDDLEQAVQLAPDLAPAWLNLSAMRIKAGDAAGAVVAARRAESLGADRAQSLFNEAIALETLGRYDAAYDAYVAAAGAAPDNATFQAQPARFRRHRPG